MPRNEISVGPFKTILSSSRIVTFKIPPSRIISQLLSILDSCFAAAKQLSKIDNNCEIILDGGILNVTILDDESIVLKGPTEISFRGTFGDRINKLIKSN